MEKQVYPCLQELQDIATRILSLFDQVKKKNIELTRVYITIDDLNRWPQEHPDAPPKVPRMIEEEHRMNYTTIARAQSTGIKLE